MISQWREDILRFTQLIPVINYGKDHFDRLTYSAISRGVHQWRNVIVSTPETFRTRYFPRNEGQPQFWGPNIIGRVVIDEFHRLRAAGTGEGYCRAPKTEGVLQVGSQSAVDQIAMMINALQPQYKWALTATPLVSSFYDCVCVARV